jgi:trehalose/maltose hydrolase-like predicted phosphorylase
VSLDRNSDTWSLCYDAFDPASEGHREALCTLGNGYFATRGAAPEAVADGIHYPGTYVAGVFNRLRTEINGQMVENESVVNLPNWLALGFRIDDGPWFDLRAVELLSYRQELDLRRAVLFRTFRWRDGDGRVTSVEQRRFVSIADVHIAGFEITVTSENWSGRLTVRSALDGRITNAGVDRYRRFSGEHLSEPTVGALDKESVFLTVRTSQSGIDVAETARTRVVRPGSSDEVIRRLIEEPGSIGHELTVTISPDQSVTIEKVVSLFTSRDRGISEPLLEAATLIGRAGSFGQLLADHVRDWAELWDHTSPRTVDGGEESLLAIRLHVFHLLQTVAWNTIDLDVGIPARGLHGEAYRGHIFWDELFVFPFLTLHLPELTRSLLLYRWRRLPEARRAASEVGAMGAMYPWQSGSNGREETQVVHLNPISGRWLSDASHLQRHINSAIVYNIWRYVQMTGDVEFLIAYGAEIILEIARFWASVAQYNPALDRYEIKGVMGPDEYHDGYPGLGAPGLNNNTYTNVMAVWVLCRALEVDARLPEPRRRQLHNRLELNDDELARWEHISHRMHVVFHHDGVLSQFEGYEDLAELDWTGLRERHADISRLDRILESEGDTPNAYKASKQADVLMLFYLLSADELRAILERLGFTYDSQTIPRTIDYYLSRTSHGSTLSRVVHAWVLARSDRERSWALFVDALGSDLDDTPGGTTAEGIHLGAMAGTLDLLLRCYLGLEISGDVLCFNPVLPAEMTRLETSLQFRSQWLNLALADRVITVEATSGGSDEALRIGCGDTTVALRAGERFQFKI